jgi:hypothetical protein
VVEIKTPAGGLSDPQQAVMSAVLGGGGRLGWCVMLTKSWGGSMHGPEARRLVLVAA